MCQLGGHRVHAFSEPGFERRLHHALHGFFFRFQRSDITAIGREKERRSPRGFASNKHMIARAVLRRAADRADQRVVRVQTPMFGATQLLVHLQSLATPRVIRRKPEASKDDSIDLLAEQHFRKCKLRFGGETRGSFVTDRQ